jgi:hypothetical protein
MPIRIGDGIMHLEIDGRIVAAATERAGGWWEVSCWPRFFDRNQAITALTVTELLERGRDSNDPLVAALRQELLSLDSRGAARSACQPGMLTAPESVHAGRWSCSRLLSR